MPTVRIVVKEPATRRFEEAFLGSRGREGHGAVFLPRMAYSQPYAAAALSHGYGRSAVVCNDQNIDI